MVVPVERDQRSQKAQKFVGNDLDLNIFENQKSLLVTGNNCKVVLSENSGVVKVIGNNCDITVLRGRGNVEYIGNYGKINLGFDASDDVVRYIGQGGKISFPNKTIDASSPVRTKQMKQNVDICNVNKIKYATSCLPNLALFSIPSAQRKVGL